MTAFDLLAGLALALLPGGVLVAALALLDAVTPAPLLRLVERLLPATDLTEEN